MIEQKLIIKYGKCPAWKKVYLDFRNRYRINEITESRFEGCVSKPYVPKINKKKVGLASVIALICIVVPFLTLFSIPVMLWGFR